MQLFYFIFLEPKKEMRERKWGENIFMISMVGLVSVTLKCEALISIKEEGLAKLLDRKSVV